MLKNQRLFWHCKRLEKKLDGNYTRMLRAILNKSWQQHPTRHQLYGHLPPITKTIQARWTRHAGHCWRSRDELISDVLLWTLAYGQSKAGRPARTYIQQLCDDTGCNPEDLPEAMNDRETWRERGSGISVLAAWHDDDDDDLYCKLDILFSQMIENQYFSNLTNHMGKWSSEFETTKINQPSWMWRECVKNASTQKYWWIIILFIQIIISVSMF